MQLNKLLRNKGISKPSGFTIIELLVVIVVIGILAAIVIVAYSGMRTKAATAILESDLTQSRTKLALYKVSHNEQYPPTEQAAKDYLTLDTNTVFEYTASNNDTTYCMTVSSDGARTSRYVNSTTETIAEGTCEGHHGYQGSQPTPPADLWTTVEAGAYHTCGVANGKAYCWGYNNYGQLGNNSKINSSTPVAVDTSGVLAGKTITAISTGSYTTCAIADGQVYCWGQNGGRLGNGNTADSSVPVAVSTSGVLAGKTVTAVSSGDSQTCAVASGQAFCWGANNYSQLGNGNTSNTTVPVAVSTSGALAGKTVTSISTGIGDACVIASDQAYCWGQDSNGQIGNGSLGGNATSPVAVSTSGVLSGKIVAGLSSGDYHNCVVAGGQAYCWGYNYFGGLGTNSNAQALVPVAVNTAGVLAGKTVTSISGGGYHTCAIANGQVYCWGYGGNGQLGNNAIDSTTSPVAVDITGILAGKTVTSISSGGYHTCAIAGGQVYCWGQAGKGQTGSGTTTDILAPVQIAPLP